MENSPPKQSLNMFVAQKYMVVAQKYITDESKVENGSYKKSIKLALENSGKKNISCRKIYHIMTT